MRGEEQHTLGSSDVPASSDLPPDFVKGPLAKSAILQMRKLRPGKVRHLAGSEPSAPKPAWPGLCPARRRLPPAPRPGPARAGPRAAAPTAHTPAVPPGPVREGDGARPAAAGGRPRAGSGLQTPLARRQGPAARPAPSAPALPLSMVGHRVIRLSLPPPSPIHILITARPARERPLSGGPRRRCLPPPRFHFQPPGLAPSFLHFRLGRGGGPWEKRVPAWTPGLLTNFAVAGGGRRAGSGRGEGGRG